MKIRIKIGNIIRSIGRRICGNYYICTHCDCIKFKEEEIMCWKCSIGEMIYQGRI